MSFRIGVMFAMELGHNEQANKDSDDGPCSLGPVVPACYGQDTDYDGTSYIHDWPGSRKHTAATSVKIQSAKGGGIGPLSISIMAGSLMEFMTGFSLKRLRT